MRKQNHSIPPALQHNSRLHDAVVRSREYALSSKREEQPDVELQKAARELKIERLVVDFKKAAREWKAEQQVAWSITYSRELLEYESKETERLDARIARQIKFLVELKAMQKMLHET